MVKAFTRADVIAEARTWLHTPYEHQGRTKGKRADCLGVLIGVTHALGVSSFDTLDYTMNPDADVMEQGLRKHLVRLSDWHDVQIADVLHLGFGKQRAQHIAIITAPGRILHAYLPKKMVVEHKLDDRWTRMIRGAYELPGVI